MAGDACRSQRRLKLHQVAANDDPAFEVTPDAGDPLIVGEIGKGRHESG